MTSQRARPQQSSNDAANDGVQTPSKQKTPPEKVTRCQRVAGGVNGYPNMTYSTTAVSSYDSCSDTPANHTRDTCRGGRR